MFNWIASLLVLFVLAAFFWPHNKSSIQEEIDSIKVNGKRQSLTSTNTDQLKRTNSFSKKNDNERVKSFRDADEFDRNIRSLINQAQKLFDQQNYTLPQSLNALKVYRDVLTLSPNNSAAKEGIENISTKLLSIGKTELKANKLTSANRILQKLISIDQASPQTILLTSDIAIWHENKKSSQLLDRADRAFEAKNYISPATKNALYFYEEMLKTEPTNKRAGIGIQKIIAVYVSRTKNALSQGIISEANTNIEILNEINPNHPEIFSLRQAITQAENNLQLQ